MNLQGNNKKMYPKKEIWKTVYKIPKYQVSSLRRIRLTKSKQVLKAIEWDLLDTDTWNKLLNRNKSTDFEISNTGKVRISKTKEILLHPYCNSIILEPFEGRKSNRYDSQYQRGGSYSRNTNEYKTYLRNRKRKEQNIYSNAIMYRNKNTTEQKMSPIQPYVHTTAEREIILKAFEFSSSKDYFKMLYYRIIKHSTLAFFYIVIVISSVLGCVFLPLWAIASETKKALGDFLIEDDIDWDSLSKDLLSNK